MKFFTIKSAAAIAGTVICLGANAGQVLVNGDFETGTVAGWSATSTQWTSFPASLDDGRNSQVVAGGGSGGPVWYVRDQQASYYPDNPATPIAGYSAFNGFDGEPGVFTLKQAFSVIGTATKAVLDFSFAAQATYSSASRTLDANILNATGTTVLYNAFHFVLPMNDTSWLVHNESFDIADALNFLGAGDYMLAFQQTIPEPYTGAALFAIDNISLDIDDARVPEPASLALLGLGLLGVAVSRRRTPR